MAIVGRIIQGIYLKTFFSFLVILSFCGNIYAQCPATGSYNITVDQNWTAIAGLSTCSSLLVTSGSTFNGNVNISYQGSNNDLVYNVTYLVINGNLNITSVSSGNTFTLAPNTTLIVLGDMGDPTNNNYQFILGDGAVLIVTGTLYGKNGNTISGSGGTVAAGSFDFSPGDLNCTGGCPTLSVGSCTDTGSACAANNSGSSLCSPSAGGTVTAAGILSTCGTSFDPPVLTASGYTGFIVRWERSTNGTTWTSINSVSNTYDPPSVTATTLYRVVVLNNTSGTPCFSYSTNAVVSVGVPNAAGAITGSSSVCIPSTGLSYSVPAIPGATSYTWAYAGTGATINGSTNPVTIDFAAGATSGTLTVRGTNSCGPGVVSSGFAITLSTGTVPALNSISNVTGCTGTTIALVTATASSGTLTSINWTNSNTSIGLAASGSDGTSPFVIPSFNASNTGQNPVTSTITVTPIGACGAGTAITYTYTINPNASITSVSGTSPLCAGSTATYTTNALVLGGGTGAWSSSNTAVATVNPTTGVVTAVSAGTCNIVYTITGGCSGTKTAQQALTVNGLPSITGTTSGSRCGTGTVTLGATASAGTINWYTALTGGSSLGTGTSFVTPSISSTTTYYVDATANGCTTATRTPVTATVEVGSTSWIGPASGSWATAGNWTCGVPTSSVDVIIPSSATPIISTTVQSKSLTISNGATLTVSASGTITVFGDINNNGIINLSGSIAFPSSGGPFTYDVDGLSDTGSLTIVSTTKSQCGSIGAIPSNATFTGNVTFQRHMSTVTGEQFRYVSSPIANASRPSNLGTLYAWNAGWSKYYANMGIGQGFAALTGASSWQVTGLINVGPHSWSGLSAGWHLVGNPYPSPVLWSNTSGWTKGNGISGTIGITDNNLSYPYYRYATYTGVYAGTDAIQNSIIAAGQAFWIYSDGLGDNTLTITEQAKNTSTAGSFYRTSEGKPEAQPLIISLKNGDAEDIAFLNLSTNKQERFSDIPKLWNEKLNVYFLDQHLEGLLKHTPSELNEEVQIPVGIKAETPGEFEISFRNVESSGPALFLIDKITGQATPVSHSYKVTINDVSAPLDDRFYLSTSPKTERNANGMITVYPNPVKDKLHVEVKSGKENAFMALTDINGKTITTSDFKGTGIIHMESYPAGVYILKVKTADGIVTKKIVK